MSDVISGWVDQEEMRRLADSLLTRPYGHELNRLEIDFGSQFEGFASDTTRVAPPKPEPRPEPRPEPAPAPIVPASFSPPSPQQLPPPVSPPSPPASLPSPVLPPEQRVQGGSALNLPQAERVAKPEAEMEAASSSGPSPSVVRSAVQFLKKAQAEGKAGGVIRGVAKQVTNAPPIAPSNVPAVNVSHPAEPEPRAIHSPFRRVNEVEQQTPSATISESLSPPIEAAPVGKLKRPPVPSGDDPILARVTHFGKWLKGPVGARNFFVSNIEGKVLIDELANPKLIQVAGSLAGASGNASGGEIGSLHVRIGEDSILEVVPTPSQFGTLILGLIVEQPLAEELIREVRLGLEEVANARLIKAKGRR